MDENGNVIRTPSSSPPPEKKDRRKTRTQRSRSPHRRRSQSKSHKSRRSRSKSHKSRSKSPQEKKGHKQPRPRSRHRSSSPSLNPGIPKGVFMKFTPKTSNSGQKPSDRERSPMLSTFRRRDILRKAQRKVDDASSTDSDGNFVTKWM